MVSKIEQQVFSMKQAEADFSAITPVEAHQQQSQTQ